MKLFFTLFLFVVSITTLAFADTNKTQSKYDARLCKIFQKKVLHYQKNMRDDAYAKTTLASYKKRAKLFCTK